MIHDPNHPIWPLSRMVAVLGSLAFILWLNAENYDVTELKTIVTMFFTLLGVEGATSAIARARK